MSKIFITGASGAGKSTIAKKIRAAGIEAVDIDHGYCAWQHRESRAFLPVNPSSFSAAFLDAHDWVCNADKVARLLAQPARPIAVVGISNNQDSILHLFNRVILLQCSADRLVERLATRTDNGFGKTACQREMILGYHRSFEEKMIRGGAIALANDGPIEPTINRIMHYLSDGAMALPAIR